MKVKDLNLAESMGKRIKIIKVCDNSDKHLEGNTGTLTSPFCTFPFGRVGVFLDKPNDCFNDICNLLGNDEVEFID